MSQTLRLELREVALAAGMEDGQGRGGADRVAGGPVMRVNDANSST